MPEYRVYTIGLDGRFVRSDEIISSDDVEAIEAARQFVDGHDVELWQRDRRIAQFKHEK
jgi:hypothetical protein